MSKACSYALLLLVLAIPPQWDSVVEGADDSAQQAVWKGFLTRTMNNAQAFEKRGEIARAVEELKVALAIDPESPSVRQELARVQAVQSRESAKHYEAGVAARHADPVQAKKEFLTALVIRPHYPEAVTQLKELQLFSAEASMQRRLQREQREESAGKSKGSSVEDKEGQRSEEDSLEMAVLAYQSGDYARAINKFKKLTAQFPNDPDIRKYLEYSYYNDGIAKFKRKDYKRAQASFSKIHKGFERVDEYLKRCGEELRRND